MSFRAPFMSPKGRKRKFSDAFILESVDDCRYNQHISADFFFTNGSDFTEKIKEKVEEEKVLEEEEAVVVFTVVEAKEILDWCAYYLANKNLFNV